MPQTTPERRARWGTSEKAIAFLKRRGYSLRPDWMWEMPTGHMIASQEQDAILYLIEEWDFGGVVERQHGERPCSSCNGDKRACTCQPEEE